MTTMIDAPTNAPAPAPDHAGPPAVPGPREYGVADLAEMAERCAAGRLFGMDAAQTFTLMLIAQARGLHPAEALMRYHVIEGRPAMRADAMQAEFQHRGGQLRWLATDEDHASLEGWHPVLHPEHLVFSVTLEELVESHVACRFDRERRAWIVKDTYRRFPRQMLRARAISEMVRAIDPGTVAGIYTPEEMADSVAIAPDRGPMPAPAAPAPPAPVRPWRREVTGPAPDRAPAPPRPPGAEDDRDAEWREFIRREIRAASDDLANECKLAGLAPPAAPVCNGHQVINHLCTSWIDEGTMDPADVAGPDGKRDRRLAAAAVAAAYGHSPEEVRAEVRDYVREKLAFGRITSGLPGPGDRDEAQATADEGAPEGEEATP